VASRKQATRFLTGERLDCHVNTILYRIPGFGILPVRQG
jgi:hypothetical protein